MAKLGYAERPWWTALSPSERRKIEQYNDALEQVAKLREEVRKISRLGQSRQRYTDIVKPRNAALRRGAT